MHWMAWCKQILLGGKREWPLYNLFWMEIVQGNRTVNIILKNQSRGFFLSTLCVNRKDPPRICLCDLWELATGGLLRNLPGRKLGIEFRNSDSLVPIPPTLHYILKKKMGHLNLRIMTINFVISRIWLHAGSNISSQLCDRRGSLTSLSFNFQIRKMK